MLLPLLSLRGLRLPNQKAILRALDLYTATALDFVDALAMAKMEALGIGEICSYDRHLDLIPDVTRVEP